MTNEAAHYWSRSHKDRDGGWKSSCHRVFIVERSTDGRYARVRIVGEGHEIMMHVVEVTRLKPGWNNWHDAEGRPFEPEGTWGEDGMYSPPAAK